MTIGGWLCAALIWAILITFAFLFFSAGKVLGGIFIAIVIITMGIAIWVCDPANDKD